MQGIVELSYAANVSRVKVKTKQNKKKKKKKKQVKKVSSKLIELID